MKITGREVIAYVAEHFGMAVDDLTGPCRRRPYVRARQVAMSVMRVACPHLSYPAVGRLLGGRDHTTVIHGERKIEELTAANDPIAEDVSAVMSYFEDRAIFEDRVVLDREIEATARRLEGLRAQAAMLAGVSA